MKKSLLGLFFISLLSCSNADDFENLTAVIPMPKVQTLTIQDDDVINGTPVFYEKLDFKFEYNQDRLVKVWDLNGNYTENLVYNNNLLSQITISGFVYPQLESQQPLNVKRNIYYDSVNRISKTENVVADPLINSFYTTFEYPSQDIIIAKNYTKYFNNTIALTKTSKIFLNNENVVKVQYSAYDQNVFTQETRYEYDQKINPNFLIDKNRILALPEYAFNIFMLQDYSQISKNNVVKKRLYSIYPTEYLMQTIDLSYNYQTNSLPERIVYEDITAGNSGLRVSAVFGY